MPRGCEVTGCESPKDEEADDGFCTKHSECWRRSNEFRRALFDGGVRLAASMMSPPALRKAMRPFKRRWVKSLGSES